MTAVRFRRNRAIELVVAQRRIGQLQGEKAELLRRLESTQGDLSSVLSENVALRRRQHELRGLIRKLAEHIRGRGIPALDAETLDRIEEEGLAE